MDAAISKAGMQFWDKFVAKRIDLIGLNIFLSIPNLCFAVSAAVSPVFCHHI
jgi:hypothetical protein